MGSSTCERRVLVCGVAVGNIEGDGALPEVMELKLLLGGPFVCVGEDEPLRLEGLGGATTISSSTTSLTGQRSLGIVHFLKKWVMRWLFAGGGGGIAACCVA